MKRRSHFWRAMYMIARSSARARMADRVGVIGSVVFNCIAAAITLGVFWVATSEHPTTLPYATIVWSIVAARFMQIFGESMLATAIAESVYSGSIALSLVRPLPLLSAFYARRVGHWAVFAATIGGPLIAVGFFLGGVPMLSFMQWLTIALLIVVALIARLALYAVIGLLAFWTENVSPFVFVTDRMFLLLNGGVVPLAFFPERVTKLIPWTPFAPSSAVPRMFDPAFAANSWSAIVNALLWTLALALVAVALQRRALRRLTINGG